MAELSEAIDLDEIAVGLPRRIHEVTARQVAKAPDRIALVEDGASWSYRDLEQRVSEIATVLSSLGIRPGDRMIIVSENCIALAALLLATSRLDAWAIVANPRLSARELDQIRDHSGARRMFFTSGISKEAAAHASRYGAENRRIGPLLEIGVGPLNESATAEPVEADPVKQVAVLIYTSGTTGTPKGVMLSHDNLLISAKTTAHIRKMNEDDKIYLVLPISHIVGISLLIMTLMTGGTVRMVSKYDPAATARAIAEEGVTILNGVPATYQRLLEYKSVSGVEQFARGSLRLITVAGAPLDLNLKLRVEKEFGLPLLNGYGITECSPGISGVRFDAPRADQAVGTVLPGVEARVRTLDGIPTARGEVGELHVRGRNVMLGYYRAPELTAKVIDSEGWFNTGDLARFDGDCLYIVGRTKEMIIRSGFNVYPAEVEAVLSSHKDVVQCAVVGRAADGNEEIVGFVQLLPGSRVTPDDLMSFIRFQLTSYKRPSKIIILDALPATSTGKILKHKLAESLRGEGAKPSGAGRPNFADNRSNLTGRTPLQKRNATVAVIGAGDFIGSEIAKKFASEGFTVFAGRRNGAKLEPLVKEIEKAGGEIHARSLDARKEEEIISFLGDADKHAPLEVCIFNIGANVNFPILDTTERVFRKVWEMACYSGFLAGREAARLMLPRGKGNIFFTGATASLRGGTGYAAFASAKFGLRAVAQATARELGPKNIHVAHLIIDSGVDTEWVRQRRIEALGPNALDDPDLLMPPSSVAESYWLLYQQPKSAWTFELEIRPFGEKW